MKKIVLTSVFLVLTVFVLTGCQKNVEGQTYSLEYNGKHYEGEYTGVFEERKPSQSGKFVSGKEGDEVFLVYDGSWDKGEMKGEGTLITNNYQLEFNGKNYEGRYTGSVKNALPEGEGQFESGKEGDENYFIYDGNWEKGIIKGEGSLNTNNYIVHFPKTESSKAIDRTGEYNGGVIGGIANGTGTFIAVNDDNEKYQYEGEWKDGLYNGEGKKVYLTNTDEHIVSEGHFTNGEFDPSVQDLVKALGTCKDVCPYELSDETYKFIAENQSVFLKHKGGIIKKKLNNNFSLKSFKKNKSSKKPQFIRIDNIQVVQAMNDTYGKTKTTYALGYDTNGEAYSLDYLDRSKRLAENNTVSLIIMPLGYSTFESITGDTPWAVSGIVVKIL